MRDFYHFQVIHAQFYVNGNTVLERKTNGQKKGLKVYKQTNMVTEKAKTIYLLYNLYTGGIGV